MNLRRVNPRLLIGILLVVGGFLSLLDVMGVISNASGIFWGLVFAAGGLIFLYMLFSDQTNNWWAAFPGFTLLGMAVSSFLPHSLSHYSGLAFFTGISLAFWYVYIVDHQRWWAIIPGGVLLTLGILSVFEEATGMETGGVLFLGLGLTFLLVAILPGGRSRLWALIPGVILLVFGAAIGTPLFGISQYFWPVLLIVLGGLLVFRFFRNQSSG
ncbi:MAG: hypothetical protein ACM3XO_11575 [Bacteroidota bacterium]|jgi:uncharacterized membrane protein (UPF0136 family)